MEIGNSDLKITSDASHIIGLTGLPSAGKGEVACALAGLAAARGWRLASISFSDQIKDEARSRGMTSLGLNVHGQNTVARSLYDSLGYDVTALQMKKPL